MPKHIGNWYINKTNCKVCMLHAVEKRAKKFNRISAETYEYLNDVLRGAMQKLVADHPTVGKTIYPPVREAKQTEETRHE